MELIRIVPGVDIQRDVLDIARLRAIMPQSGEIPRVTPSIMTGDGFQLRLD
jgi:acyl CoA:acetate/3-ketoacid CoA transferase